MKNRKIGFLLLSLSALVSCSDPNLISHPAVQDAAPVNFADSTSSSSKVTAWTSEEENVMKDHLGGATLPFLNLTNPTITFKYDTSSSYSSTAPKLNYGYLLIDCDNPDTDDAKVVNLLKKAGYTEDTDDVESYSSYRSTFSSIYKKDSILVFVDSRTENTDTDNETYYLRLYVAYDEAYDKTKKASSWPSNVEQKMKDTFNNHVIPVLYLATANNLSEPTLSTYYNTLNIYGGKWDDQVVADTKADLTAAGYNVEDGDSSYYSPKFTATHTESDGSIFKISLKKSSNNQVEIDIYQIAAFDPTKYTDWEDSVKAQLNTALDGHILPFIYMRTNKPSVRVSDSSVPYSIILTGKEWDDKVTTLAFNALKNDRWTNIVNNSATSTTSDIVTADKTYDDGCYCKFSLGNDSYSKVTVITLTYTPKVAAPDTYKDWSEDTLKDFSKYLGGNKIPYIYLNLVTPTSTSTEKTEYSEREHTLTVSGGEWNPNFLPIAKSSFTSAGWTEVEDETAGEDTVTYTHTYNGEKEDGSTITARVGKLRSDDYYSSFYNCGIVFKRIEQWNPTAFTSWDAATQAEMDKDWGKEAKVPYLYLGTSAPTFEYGKSDDELIITGSEWVDGDNGNAALFNKAFDYKGVAKDGWTWRLDDTTTDRYGTVTYNATGIYTDKTKITASLSKNSYGFAVLNLIHRPGFNASKFTAWPAEILNAMQTKWGDSTKLPAIYLGTDTPEDTTSSYSSGKDMAILGGFWSNEVLASAKSTLTTNGFMASIETGSYSYSVQAYKLFDDGSALRVTIYRTNNNDNAHIKMDLYYSEPITATLPTTYDAAAAADTTTETKTNTETIRDALKGHDLPVLPIPSVPTKIETSSYMKYFDVHLKGGSDSLNFGYLLKAKDTLEALNAETELRLGDKNLLSKNSATLKASVSVKNAEGKEDGHIDLLYKSSYSGYDIYASYIAPFVSPTGSDAVWDTESDITLNKYLGDVTLPYLYLGIDKPEFSKFRLSKDSYYGSTTFAPADSFDISGGDFDEALFTNAEKVFSQDAGYTSHYDTVNFSGKAFVASKKIDSTGKTLTVYVYDKYNSDYNHHQSMMTVVYR